VTEAAAEGWVAWMRDQGLVEFELENATTDLRLRLPEPAPTRAPEHPDNLIRSFHIGRLRLTHPHRDAAEVGPGDRVCAGTVVAYVESGGRLLPVTAPRGGVIARAVLRDGDIVDYARPVFEMT